MVSYDSPTNRWHRRKGKGKGSRLPKWSGPLVKESGTWFPTDVEAAFAASVRLPRGTALLVDTGSPGNIVGSAWPQHVERHSEGDSAYDAVIHEAHPSGALAWKLAVNSSEPSASYTHASGGEPLGWAIHSVARFYEAPLLAGNEGGTLSSSTHA